MHRIIYAPSEDVRVLESAFMPWKGKQRYSYDLQERNPLGKWRDIHQNLAKLTAMSYASIRAYDVQQRKHCREMSE